jgi:hypothetical protein
VRTGTDAYWIFFAEQTEAALCRSDASWKPAANPAASLKVGKKRAHEVFFEVFGYVPDFKRPQRPAKPFHGANAPHSPKHFSSDCAGTP